LRLAKQKEPAATETNTADFAGETNADLTGMNILLAEDNPVNMAVGTRQLKKVGCSVDVADNGIDAVTLWRERKHRIVILDCQMPKMDGYEAAQKIREIEQEQKLPQTFIIALTACAMDGDRELCLAAGMNDYISKPVKESELKAALGRGVANNKKVFSGAANGSHENAKKSCNA